MMNCACKQANTYPNHDLWKVEKNPYDYPLTGVPSSTRTRVKVT